MTCRTTHVGYVATSLTTALTSLNDRQVSSLFHALQRERRTDTGPASPMQQTWAVGGLRIDLNDAPLRPARAATLARRLDQAANEQMSVRMAFAVRRLTTVARAAEREIDRRVRRYATRTGVTVEEARATYEAMMRPGGDATRVAPSPDWERAFREHNPRMPVDQTTLSALEHLDTHVPDRCGTCGQFTAEGHSCAPLGSAEERAATTARAMAGDLTNPGSIVRTARAGGLIGTRFDDTPCSYVASRSSFEAPQVSRIRDAAQNHAVVSIPLTARVHTDQGPGYRYGISDEACPVEGRVSVDYDAIAGRYTVTPVAATSTGRDGALRCPCPEYQQAYDCEHVHEAATALAGWLNVDAQNLSPSGLDEAVADVSADLARDRAESIEAQQAARATVPESCTSYAEDMSAFRAAYKAAKDRAAAGEPPIEYLTENATGGLGAPGTGREFGVELEYDFPEDWTSEQRRAANRAIGQALYDAGLTTSRAMGDYHDALNSGYSREHARGWSFEYDGTVAAEVVSPIMSDTPETWQTLRNVCDIIREHGGVAAVNAGSHVHVSASNYDHTVENHNRLVGMFHQYQDVIYRLSANPERGTHRGAEWCAPNRAPGGGYTTVASARNNNHGHGLGLNLQSVTGRTSDHVEFRTWDASLDPAVIQTQIKTSLAITEAAFRTAGQPSGEGETLGSHRRARFQEHGAGRRNLTGEAWKADTASFRQFVDEIFTRDTDKEQATALFAVTRWQRRGRG